MKRGREAACQIPDLAGEVILQRWALAGEAPDIVRMWPDMEYAAPFIERRVGRFSALERRAF